MSILFHVDIPLSMSDRSKVYCNKLKCKNTNESEIEPTCTNKVYSLAIYGLQRCAKSLWFPSFLLNPSNPNPNPHPPGNWSFTHWLSKLWENQSWLVIALWGCFSFCPYINCRHTSLLTHICFCVYTHVELSMHLSNTDITRSLTGFWS